MQLKENMRVVRTCLLAAAFFVSCLLPLVARAQQSLGLAMTGPATAIAYRQFSYTLVITNPGGLAGNGYFDFYIVDQLPAGTKFVSASGFPWGCQATGATVSCDGSFFPVRVDPGTPVSVNITVASDGSTACAPLSNTATLVMTDGSGVTLTTAPVVTTLSGCDALYTVTSSAGADGSISPGGPQQVGAGSKATFTVAPASGFTASVDGTCGGQLSGSTYVTSIIIDDCTVSASFHPNIYTITPSAGPHGSISPSTPVLASDVSQLHFTVTPDAGYQASPSGTCHMSYSAPDLFIYLVNSDCTAQVNFVSKTKLTISDPTPVFGEVVTLAATFVGNPVGTVSFSGWVFLGGSESYCTNVPIVESVATCSTSIGLIAAPLIISASTNIPGSGQSGDSLQLSVGFASTTTTVNPMNSAVAGYPLVVSAAVNVVAPSVAAPKGTVTITDSTDNTSCSYVLGAAPAGCTIVAPSGGSKQISASFAGDFGFNSSASVPVQLKVADRFAALDPARILDTRPAQLTIDHLFEGQGAVAAQSELDLDTLGRGGIAASGVAAVVLNVTVTNPTAAGFITVWPAGEARPVASNLNFAPGDSVSNLVIVKVGAAGKVALFNSAGSTDLIADVVGFFTSGSDLTSFAPARLLDTRAGRTTVDGLFAGQGALAAQTKLDLPVAGRGGGIVPASGAGAVILNVTATGPTANGFVTAWPTGGPRPTASTLNFVPGQTIPNLAVVQLGSGGAVSLFNSQGSTDLIVDVTGWLPTTSELTPLVPARVLDTRAGRTTVDGLEQGNGVLPARTTFDLPIWGRGGVPPGATGAVNLNVTVTSPSTQGFLVAWPSGAARPKTSNINFRAGQTIANLVIARIGANGKVSLFANADTDIVVDVLGCISESP